jgi:hypothetical protein
MPVQRFTNSTEGSLTVVVEPWATEIEVPPGETLVSDYDSHPERESQSSVEVWPDQITFWCEGSNYRAEMKGVALDI